MEGMGLKFTPVIGRRLLRHSSTFGLWLALLGLIASPNRQRFEYRIYWSATALYTYTTLHWLLVDLQYILSLHKELIYINITGTVDGYRPCETTQ